MKDMKDIVNKQGKLLKRFIEPVNIICNCKKGKTLE
jgi:hypothetical protein